MRKTINISAEVFEMDALNKLRRSSFSPFGTSTNQEPLITVTESEQDEKEEVESVKSSPKQSLDIESPQNPYLLSPWRDPRETRKHSLPTPPCMSGITASQVRRLSERGGEGSGPSPMEQAFLATLCQSAQSPAPGGRRHSVVTISKVPTTIFGRNRRESIAAVPTFQRCSSGTTSRRESIGAGPPSTDLRGSIHNLQLDIMDDIVQARKARMKLWNTSSEKVCEVQTVDEAGTTSSAQRYSNRRFSEFVSTTLTPIPQASSQRRASENPCMLSPSVTPSKKSGIVCTNTDLISLLSSLASSATEISRVNDVQSPSSPACQTTSNNKNAECSLKLPERRTSLKKSNRSRSFDVSIIKGVKPQTENESKCVSMATATAAANWFTKRHTPVSKRTNSVRSSANATVSFARETFDKLTESKESTENQATIATTSQTNDKSGSAKKKKEHKSPLSRLKWDGKSAVVDARMIGSAIEGFLRGASGSSSKSPSTSKQSSKETSKTKKTSKTSWFSRTEEEDSSGDTCDSSLCATLKDLFVK